MVQAFRSNEGAIADIMDRRFPNPRRTEISGLDGAPVTVCRAITTGSVNPEEAAAAEDPIEQIERAGAVGEGEG